MLCDHIWSFKVINRLNIRKSLTESENSDNWLMRNSVYYTSIGHSQNVLKIGQDLLIFSQTYWYKNLFKIYWFLTEFISQANQDWFEPVSIQLSRLSVEKCDFCSVLFKINFKLYLAWYPMIIIYPNIWSVKFVEILQIRAVKNWPIDYNGAQNLLVCRFHQILLMFLGSTGFCFMFSCSKQTDDLNKLTHRFTDKMFSHS